MEDLIGKKRDELYKKDQSHLITLKDREISGLNENIKNKEMQIEYMKERDNRNRVFNPDSDESYDSSSSSSESDGDDQGDDHDDDKSDKSEESDSDRGSDDDQGDGNKQLVVAENVEGMFKPTALVYP